VNELSWIILLILLAGLILALVTGGWTGNGGATTWFKVKFLGQSATGKTA
jgi:hypothetical protein